MQTRRQFLASATIGAASLGFSTRARAQQITQTFSGPMEQDAYRPVKLAAKANARASMADAERDDLEHQLKCQCGCPLDIYTCRTTDFSCSVSPAMHADVLSLVDGGYAAKEILSAFQSVYGERVLMSPLKKGFNWLGYVTPSIAISAGAVIVFVLIRKWGERAAARPVPGPVSTNATAAELDAISVALKDDS
ncbi:MAG TPA: cytochrome c-type biogenesis protein CcmH [Gemmatimonadaceae bacterium]|nr:cytochrome c-type biogenesis protein CcmH [Gemmatimonadaceae bacterium]